MGKRLTTEEFINRSKIIHNNKYDYSLVKYKNNKTKVKIICPIHGIFEQVPNSHLNNNGCSKCYSDGLKTNIDDFIESANQKHNNKYNYDKVCYINTNTKVIITCPVHGDFEQNPADHLKGNGCPRCILKSQTILFQKLQKSFPDELFIWEYSPEWLNKQRLDIFIPKYNLAIEYNGQLHYQSIEYFGGDKKFELQQKRDELKRKKCKDNDCILFEMKYDYNENDYEKLVDNIKSIIKEN